MTDELRAGRGLDAACARALGWTHYPVYLPGPVTYYGLPSFTTSTDAARLLEDEIQRRGRWHLYVDALIHVVLDDGEDVDIWMVAHVTRADLWELIRATPEQRARAFLEAMKGAGE